MLLEEQPSRLLGWRPQRALHDDRCEVQVAAEAIGRVHFRHRSIGSHSADEFFVCDKKGVSRVASLGPRGGVDKMDFLLLCTLSGKEPKEMASASHTPLSLSPLSTAGLCTYVKHAEANRMQRKNTLDLLEFQNEVAMALIMCSKNVAKKRGRPSLQEPAELPAKYTTESQGQSRCSL
ncbi:hypothetical protein HPB48_019518 [Haemaphysalis longicornis]|uniref:Uncharacterized protein n=1 Tax=Haemaphysalis longicornis TaxID=44386 RepID=A0A9J6GLM8_HAELO|nr:hypothetical protein HPB48_019518 [Haemaphysalis longicornis]